jgi:NAD(P)H-dependent FMN reductase
MIKILAINGSYHTKGAINALMDRAIAGVKSVIPEAEVEKIHLIDRRIEYCRGCLTCRNDDPEKTIAACVIDDDMGEIYQKLDEADGYIFGTPIYEATVTAVMKTFLERFCWVMSKPGRWPLRGCPTPRTSRKKAAIVITSSGLAPLIILRLLSSIRKVFRDIVPCILNGKIVGILYAGAVGMDNPKADRYFSKASALGNKFGRTLLRLRQ